MFRFFDLLKKSSSESMTQELLSLVTSLAKNLKYLIRTALAFSLSLEQDHHIQTGISDLLNQLSELDKKRVWIAGRYWFKEEDVKTVDFISTCMVCHESILSEGCYQCLPHKCHPQCFQCTQCSTQLSINSAVFTPSNKLYCNTCHPAIEQKISFSYSYEQQLNHLKYYLAKQLVYKKKSDNTTIILPDSKRQRSLLRKLVNRQDTIPLKQGQMADKKNKSNLTIDTNSTPTVMTESPVSASSPINRIKRSFSARRKSSTLYHLFLDKKKARRASILTMDEYGQTTHKYAQMTNFTPSQNTILRDAAILGLHPLVSHRFTLDELVSLVKQPSSSPSALWGKLITHIRSSSPSSTFGASLAMVAQRDHDYLVQQRKEQGVTLRDDTPTLTACFSENACIPSFIQACIMVILQSDMSVEGVFRKNGNIRQLKTTAEIINQLKTPTVQSMEPILKSQTGVQLAALLKRYLRELPQPLFPFGFHRLFIECSKEPDELKRKQTLHLACCLLPKPNRDTMCMIFCCLKWVASFSDKNKMDVPNLARVIAPSVLFSNKLQQQQQLEEIHVIETLIQEIDEISIVSYTPYCKKKKT